MSVGRKPGIRTEPAGGRRLHGRNPYSGIVVAKSLAVTDTRHEATMDRSQSSFRRRNEFPLLIAVGLQARRNIPSEPLASGPTKARFHPSLTIRK